MITSWQVTRNWDCDRSLVLGWRYHASQLINPGIAISIVSGRELVHFAILDTSDNFERVPMPMSLHSATVPISASFTDLRTCFDVHQSSSLVSVNSCSCHVSLFLPGDTRHCQSKLEKVQVRFGGGRRRHDNACTVPEHSPPSLRSLPVLSGTASLLTPSIESDAPDTGFSTLAFKFPAALAAGMGGRSAVPSKSFDVLLRPKTLSGSKPFQNRARSTSTSCE